MDAKVYINGKIVPEAKASISVFDRGLNYGDGLFETVKAYNSSPAFLKAHIKRLKHGAEFLGIPVKLLKPLEAEIKHGVLEKLLKANALDKGRAYLKIIVTRGVYKHGHGPSKNIKPTIIIIAKPLDVKMISKLQKNGIKAVAVNSPLPAMPEVKTLNYLPNVLAKADAVKQGAFEGLFVNKNGRITEGSSSNIFVVSKGVVKTPPVERSALAGVTRLHVITCAKELGLKVKECSLTAGNILKSDEAFLTNSIIEVVPLIQLSRKKIGSGKPGAVTRILQKAYERAASS